MSRSGAWTSRIRWLEKGCYAGMFKTVLDNQLSYEYQDTMSPDAEFASSRLSTLPIFLKEPGARVETKVRFKKIPIKCFSVRPEEAGVPPTLFRL